MNIEELKPEYRHPELEETYESIQEITEAIEDRYYPDEQKAYDEIKNIIEEVSGWDAGNIESVSEAIL